MMGLEIFSEFHHLFIVSLQCNVTYWYVVFFFFFQINNVVNLFLCLITNLTMHMFETSNLVSPVSLAWYHNKPLTSKFSWPKIKEGNINTKVLTDNVVEKCRDLNLMKIWCQCNSPSTPLVDIIRLESLCIAVSLTVLKHVC